MRACTTIIFEETDGRSSYATHPPEMPMTPFPPKPHPTDPQPDDQPSVDPHLVENAHLSQTQAEQERATSLRMQVLTDRMKARVGSDSMRH